MKTKNNDIVFRYVFNMPEVLDSKIKEFALKTGIKKSSALKVCLSKFFEEEAMKNVK